MKNGQKLIIAAVSCVVATLAIEFINVQHYFNLNVASYSKLLYFGLTGQWSEAPVFYEQFAEQFAMLFIVSCEIAAFFFVKRGER